MQAEGEEAMGRWLVRELGIFYADRLDFFKLALFGIEQRSGM